MKYATEAVQFGAVLVVSHLVNFRVFQTHLAAHALPQLFGFTTLAFIGTKAWFFEGAYRRLLNDTSVPTLSAVSDSGLLVTTLQAVFQVYEILCALAEKRLRGVNYDLLLHHCFALALAALVVVRETGTYYAIYFSGISEISSMFLAVVDLFKHQPQLVPRYPNTNECARTIFGVLFLTMRSAAWPIVLFRYAQVHAGPLFNLENDEYPFDAAALLIVGLTTLTCLQLYWTLVIIKGLMKKMAGDTVSPTIHERGKDK